MHELAAKESASSRQSGTALPAPKSIGCHCAPAGERADCPEKVRVIAEVSVGPIFEEVAPRSEKVDSDGIAKPFVAKNVVQRFSVLHQECHAARLCKLRGVAVRARKLFELPRVSGPPRIALRRAPRRVETVHIQHSWRSAASTFDRTPQHKRETLARVHAELGLTS